MARILMIAGGADDEADANLVPAGAAAAATANDDCDTFSLRPPILGCTTCPEQFYTQAAVDALVCSKGNQKSYPV